MPAVREVTDATRLTDVPITEQAELVQAFETEGVSGTIALFEAGKQEVFCSDAERCRKVHLPASTYKIPNSIIGLETGVLTDSESMLPWDGKPQRLEEWNRDLTLRAAVRVSCVPCFQEIARRIGDERMRDWIVRLDYGNKDISGGVDRFWLTGGLRISPIQELDFVRRLELGKLPISERTREIVIDVITLDVTEGYALRGKTGFSSPPDNKELVAWFVGWAERGDRKMYFATALDGFQGDVDILKARRRVTEAVLAKHGMIPEPVPPAAEDPPGKAPAPASAKPSGATR